MATEVQTDLIRCTITTDEAGQRLDRWLCRMLRLSRREAQRILAQGAVAINGKRVLHGAKGRALKVGCEVVVHPFTRGEDETVLANPRQPLTILTEGDGYLVVDKPAGLPVHPQRVDEWDTLLNAVVARYPQVQGVGEGGLRSGVVHRLDTDTSGALLVAIEEGRWQKLRVAFREHRIGKTYRVIVHGRLTGEGHEVMNLMVARQRPARVRVVMDNRLAQRSGVRRCDLAWRAVRSLRMATLLEIDLGTGFLHQVRVMLAHLEHPVVGDRIYAEPSLTGSISAPRQMLHAASIQVGNRVTTSSDPADFTTILQQLEI